MTDFTSATAVALRLARDGVAPEQAARSALRGLTSSELRSLAADAIETLIRKKLRANVRDTENAVFDDPEYQQWKEEHDREFRQRMTSIVADYATQLRMQWTADLLASTFSIDGREVTWGEATRDQHQQYAALLTAQATSTLDTAAKHHAAIRTLDDTGAECLNEALANA